MAIGTILTALGLIKDFAPALGKVTERFIDGKASTEELHAEANKHAISADVQLALAQIQLNTKEAEHQSIFVAGWRPFVGWTCAVALAFNYVALPLGEFVALLSGYTGAFPQPLDFSVMSSVLLGMLGLGGLRTFEKSKGIAKGSMKSKLGDF